MKRTFYILAFAVTVSISGPASAQAPKGKKPLRPPEIQKDIEDALRQVEQLQKEFDNAFKQAGAFQPVPRGFSRGNGITWGGVRFGKVDAALQEQIGLPDNEGLLVQQVDAGSAAEKAGLKTSDVLVKIHDKAVPSDLDSFAKLVKDQKPNEAMDLVVVRDGMEHTLKGAQMPNLVTGGFGPGGFGPGGKFGRPNPFGGIGGMRRIEINGGNFNGFNSVNIQFDADGARITRKQTGNQFTSEYAKGDLNVTIKGMFDAGVAKPSEIIVNNGKESKTYSAVADVPAEVRPVVNQIMPASNPILMPMLPDLRRFPGLPVIPGVDN